MRPTSVLWVLAALGFLLFSLAEEENLSSNEDLIDEIVECLQKLKDSRENSHCLCSKEDQTVPTPDNFKVFLSFRGESRLFVEGITSKLFTKRYFYDSHTLPHGEPYPQPLLNELFNAQAGVIFFSPHFFDQPWPVAEFKVLWMRYRYQAMPLLLFYQNVDPNTFLTQHKELFRSLYIDVEEVRAIGGFLNAPLEVVAQLINNLSFEKSWGDGHAILKRLLDKINPKIIGALRERKETRKTQGRLDFFLLVPNQPTLLHLFHLASYMKGFYVEIATNTDFQTNDIMNVPFMRASDSKDLATFWESSIMGQQPWLYVAISPKVLSNL